MFLFPCPLVGGKACVSLAYHSCMAPGPAETVGQVGHLPYHFLVVHTGNDVCDDFYPR